MSTARTIDRRPAAASPQLDDAALDCPAILHITHWKGGSQWIHKILCECCPERVVAPTAAYDHLQGSPVQPGKIYVTVYATREQLDPILLPPNTRRFIVIRDLRDALVSSYFSKKVSHHAATTIAAHRTVLQQCSEEEGFLFLIDQYFDRVAAIVRSWLGTSDPLLRYEELLHDDERLLEEVLLGHCRLPVPRERVLAAIRNNRFEQLTRGRSRGDEDITAHERKGIAGDWRNHFTPRIKEAFKAKWGQLIVDAGYESGLDW